MLDLLKSLGLWGTLYAALFSLLWTFLALMKGKDDPSRKRVIHYLENDTPAQTYRRTLTALLNWLDTHLSAREIELKIPETAPNRAWSGGLLNLLLVLALAYPLLSIFGQWVLFGEGRAGDAILFPPGDPDLVRYGFGAAFLAFVAIFVYAQVKFSGTPRRVIQLVAALLLLAGVSAVAGEGAFAVAYIVSAAFVFLATGAVAVTSAGTVTFAGAATIAFAVVFAFSSAAAAAAAVAATVAGAVAVARKAETGPRPLRPLMLFALFGLGIVGSAIFITPEFPANDEFSKAHRVLFFSALPLINALFDFASVGLTRYWLRKGLSGNMLWNGLRDAGAGLMIFLALGCSIIAFIHLVRPQDNVPLVNLTSMFADLEQNHGNYWWLFFMVFSTLIPTVTHAGIALFSIFTLAGSRLRNWLAQLFRMGGKGDAHPEWIARTVLSALIAAAIWTPAFIIVEGLALFPGAVTALIGIFAGFATLIGAI